MPRALRVVFAFILSVSFIFAPTFALRNASLVYARESAAQGQAEKHTPRNLAAHEPNTLLVKFYADAGAQSQYLLSTFGKKQQALRGQSGIIKLTLKDNLDVGETMDLLREITGAVEWVEPNYLVKRASAKSASSRPLVKAAAPKNDARGKRTVAGSNSTIIAIIDSGVDLNHRELKSLLWANEAEKAGERLARNGVDDDRNGFVDDLKGWNFVADNSDVRDDIGHGTQVAGIIANAAGIEAGQREAATRILPLKALDQSGTGTVAEVVEAMDYAVARHAVVINCSFGTPGFSQFLLNAIKRAETAGIVVVAAAGNEARDLSLSPFYPASFRTDQVRNLISVAATEERKPGEVRLAGFSNFNADIAAPGTDIRTTNLKNSQVNLTGTSAAAGSVTGAVARLKRMRGWVSAQTIRDSLLKTAQESPGLLGALSKVSSRGSINPKGALALFTRENSSGKGKTGQKGKGEPVELSPDVQMAIRAGANLDLLRNNKPQRPDPYQPVGTLPGAEQGSFSGRREYLTAGLPGPNYDDPKPTITTNYNAYLTELSKASNAAGPAGSQPMQNIDPTAGTASVGGFSYNLDSKNYNFMVPVMGLAGRAGLDLSLALSYNSNVWVRDAASNTVAFNADRGFPAPGWRLGFGAIQIHTNTTGVYSNGVTGQASIIYIAPDGTRRDMAQIPGTSKYKTYDSSYIVFDAAAQIMYFPNGTQAKYGSAGYSYDASNYDFQALPLEIKDRNGNFITINYKTLNCGSNGSKTVIDYVIDTAGRQFNFGYQNNRLVYISQSRSGLGWSVQHWYVYIDYDPVTIQTNFSGGATTDPSTINGTAVYFPTRITYSTGVNFRFTYTSYGQISTVEKWVPTITGQGTARKIASTSFDVPTYNPSYFQSASPFFSTRTEWAENWNGGSPAYYQYNYTDPNGPYVRDPTLRIFQLKTAALSGGGWLQTEWVGPTGATDWLKKDETTYTSDASLSYPSNLRPVEIKKTAKAGTSVTAKRTTITYTVINDTFPLEYQMSQPEYKDEFVGDTTTLYRRTKTTYKSFLPTNILGLVEETSTYNGASTPVLIARSKNYYDEAAYFQDASSAGVIQHDNTNYGYGFSARGNLTSVEQFLGASTTSRFVKRITYDTNGNVRAETDAAGNSKQIEYADNYSNKPSGVGQTHAYAYTVADPIGFRAGSQWNYFIGQPVKTFNLAPSSSTETQVSHLTYDFADRPLRVTRPDTGWTQTDHWDSLLAVAISTDVGGGNVAHKYEQFDGAGRTFKKGNDHPDGVSGKFSGQVIVSDIVGQVKDTSNVLAINGFWAPAYEDALNSFLFTHLTRDELSRLKVITYPDGNSKQVAYEGCGCAGNAETRVTDELGQETITKTDFLGRLLEATEPDTSVGDGVYSRATYHYDELDRLLRIEHRGRYNGTTGHTPTQNRYFNYDGYGRLVSEDTPEGGIVNYTYTAKDQVQTVTNQRSITVTNSYDAQRNLLTGVSYSDGTPSVSYGYDDFGARTSMTDGEGTTTYSYNTYRQLESETRTFTALSGNYYKLAYAYDVTGLPTQVNYGVYTLSGGTPVYSFNKNVNYAYNTVSALSGIGTNLIGSNPSATTNVISSATYRAGGAVNVLTYGNGRRLTMDYYQQRSQSKSMKVDLVSNPADKIIDYSYDYNDLTTGQNNNRIRKITDGVDGTFTTTYTYDQYNRLTYAASGAYSSYFAYDHFGNITNYQGMTLNYAANASGAPATNRISTAVNGSTTDTHTYDAAGNLTNDGVQAYTYDGANRLKEVGTGGQNTYGYDGDGMRVRKTESGAALFYVRSAVLKNVAMEVNQSQGVVRAYVYSNGKLIAERSSDNNFYWVHKDHLGSGRKLTDSTGALQFRSEYSAYGQLIFNWSASSAPNPSTRKFTGYERDAATGLDYANARMYGSNYGRFTTADPAGQQATDPKRPQSLNRYAYVENDPVNFHDPSGKLLAYPGDGCITYYLDGTFWFNTCGSTTLGGISFGYGWDGTGSGSGSTQKPLAKFDFNKFKDCLEKIFKPVHLKLVSFNSATLFRNGSAVLELETAGGKTSKRYTITGDSTSQTGAQNKPGDWADGATYTGNPTTNYIANDIREHFGVDPVIGQVIVTATHVHEIAHSAAILSGYDPPGGDEGGATELEKCVYGGVVQRDGTVN